MKTTSTRNSATVVALLVAGLTTAVLGQNYDLSWRTIDGGGGNSTGGTYSLEGTIGQPDAQTPPVMSGGTFTLTGGYWPGVSVCTLAGDLNLDGQVDGEDIQRFVDCLIAASGVCDCADLDGGGLDLSDVTAFVSALVN